jgi:predicted hotdog family 3-hydroxylacyl-ACP dehydratase
VLSPPLLLGRDWIAARVPHHGAMCLLDALLAWDEQHIHCTSTTHHSPDNPLRAAGRLGAACALEYAAQAMALHGALSQHGPDAEPRAGMLAAVRELELAVARLDDLPGALEIHCERLHGDSRTMLYRFTVSCAGGAVASGRATVVSGPRA